MSGRQPTRLSLLDALTAAMPSEYDPSLQAAFERGFFVGVVAGAIKANPEAITLAGDIVKNLLKPPGDGRQLPLS